MRKTKQIISFLAPVSSQSRQRVKACHALNQIQIKRVEDKRAPSFVNT